MIYSSSGIAEETQNFNQEFLFLPHFHTEVRPDVEHNKDLHSIEFNFGSDFLYSAGYKKFRLLTEFFISVDEIELERLKFAYEINPDNTLWVGRFHSPMGYWNSQYHHGLHLQTSVHRPGVIEYEDDGGVLSNHMTGAMLNSSHYFDESILHISTAIGTAPLYDNDSLHTWAYSARKAMHSGQGVLKIAFQPDELDPTQFGAFASYLKINSEDTRLKHVFQFVSGAFVHLDGNYARLTTAAYYIDNKIAWETGTHSSGFLAAYAHAEYDLASKVILYGRVERTSASDHDQYIELMGDPDLGRNLVGLRFDFTRRQAVSTEFSNRINDHDSHTHISFQWSAVFP